MLRTYSRCRAQGFDVERAWRMQMQLLDWRLSQLCSSISARLASHWTIAWVLTAVLVVRNPPVTPWPVACRNDCFGVMIIGFPSARPPWVAACFIGGGYVIPPPLSPYCVISLLGAHHSPCLPAVSRRDPKRPRPCRTVSQSEAHVGWFALSAVGLQRPDGGCLCDGRVVGGESSQACGELCVCWSAR